MTLVEKLDETIALLGEARAAVAGANSVTLKAVDDAIRTAELEAASLSGGVNPVTHTQPVTITLPNGGAVEGYVSREQADQL